MDDFYEKRSALQLREAKLLAVSYYERFGKRPPEEIFHEYFMLFTDTSAACSKAWCANKMKLLGNYEASVEYLQKNPPLFSNYEQFLTFCFKEKENLN